MNIQYSEQDPKLAALDGEIFRLACQAENDWLDGLAKKHFPPAIYESVQRKQNLGIVSRWMERVGYRLHVFPDHKELRLKDKVLGTFKLTFKSPPYERS